MLDTAHRIVESLEIDELPRGRISRLWVRLVRDGLGAPLGVPMLVARGERAGPIFGVTAAVHGNELNGIPVIHRLFESLDPGTIRGTIAAVVVVNVPGLMANTRTFNDGTDLNHIFPGRADGNVAQVYAHRLVQRIVNRFEYLVDLHTASFGRINSLYVRADLDHPDSARMARIQRPEIIVHNEPSDHTLRGTAMELDIAAITVEVGNPQRFQRSYIKRSVTGLRHQLADIGVLRKRPLIEKTAPVICERSFWIYTDCGGLLEVFPEVTDLLRAGDLIARVTDAFGDVLREYHAPHAGIVIGKSTNPVAQTGARVLHLGVVSTSALRRNSKES